MTICTLDEGFYAYVREIDEHQIEEEKLGDRFGLAFAKTEYTDWRGDELETTVRFWRIEAFEEEATEEVSDAA